jgi:hypothetical protein
MTRWSDGQGLGLTYCGPLGRERRGEIKSVCVCVCVRETGAERVGHVCVCVCVCVGCKNGAEGKKYKHGIVSCAEPNEGRVTISRSKKAGPSS